MRTIINKYILGSAVVVLTLGSCSKKFITKSPNDQLLFDQAFDNTAALQGALNGAYNQLGQVGVYGRDLPVVGDLMADNVYVQAKNSNRYLAQWAYNVTSQNSVPGDAWTQCYGAILRANQIIDAKLTGADVAPIKAQAYGIRALMYFKLVTYFATPYTVDSSALGVPVTLHYSPFALPTRSSVGTVYNQIVHDLDSAILIAPDYSNSITLSHYSLEALLARTYLYMGNYALAKSTAEDVINNSGFSLVDASDLVTFWGDPGVKSDQIEVMFEINQDVLVNNGFDDLGGIYYNGYADLYCSDQLYQLYSGTDARQQLIQPGHTKAGASAWSVRKFPNAQSADRDNLKVIRLAEVYLIGAEAAARTNDVLNAQGWLNDLMASRDPAFGGYADNGQALIDDIILEKRKELAFEGDRFFDLNRLQLPINRGKDPGALQAGANDASLSIPWPDSRRVAPIPNAEIQANANIAKQQNPGY
jgi:hypothetical protein